MTVEVLDVDVAPTVSCHITKRRYSLRPQINAHLVSRRVKLKFDEIYIKIY